MPKIISTKSLNPAVAYAFRRMVAAVDEVRAAEREQALFRTAVAVCKVIWARFLYWVTLKISPTTVSDEVTDNRLIYLAAPYASKEAVIRERRHVIVNKVAAELLSRGKIVFSPLTHNVPLGGFLPDEQASSWPFWKRVDFAVLDKCDALYVLMLPGWTQSVGVTAEINRAGDLGIPVTYLRPTGV